VLSCLELAARADSSEARLAWLTFVIAGGGPTGVEYAGALSELLRMVLGRDFPELDAGDARIVLVEGQDRLLGTFHPKLGTYARRTLISRGVDVRTSTFVEGATDDAVTLSGGESIASRTLVWSAGVRPADPLDSANLRRSRSRRLEVDDRLRLIGHPDAFVIGDAASVSDRGHELPMLSPPAMQAGRHVAHS